MDLERKQLVRADDFVAGSLEAMAEAMPDGYKDEADILRKHAAQLRNSANTKMIRVEEAQ
jgi:hypothetical protein